MDVTYNFTAGTRAVGQQVNQNFADVKSAVDPLETAVASIETQLTSGIILPDGSIDFTRLQSYKSYTVSNATNATPIVITAVAHSFLTGDKVFISGVGGNTAANGTFTITKIGADTFSLDGSVGNGAFTTNGMAVIYPSADDNIASVAFAKEASFPSSKYIELTLGASGSTYTAPADGWYYFRAVISNISGGYCALYFNSEPSLGSKGFSDVNTGFASAYIPVLKGQTIIATYKNVSVGSNTFLKFIYAEGAK